MSDHGIASRDETQTVPSWLLFLKIFLKTTALSFVFVLIFLLITALFIGAIAHTKLSQFETLARTNRNTLFNVLKDGWDAELVQNNNTVTFLVLGVDTLATRGDIPPLTDTMLLATVHVDTGEVHLLPIPRDLWSPEYRTKVNALYSYGLERFPESPQQFPLEVIQTETGVPVQHTIVLSMETLAKLIDAVGGVTIDAPTAFKDELFPKNDVDVTVETDPAKLYKTVEFQAGEQQLSGDRALEYIRSRHSETEEGSDTARSTRQQLVIQALLKKLLTANTLKSPETMAQLYLLYQDSFNQYLPLSQLIALGKKLYPVRNQVVFYNESISIYPENQDGSLIHPQERQYENQWVYIVRDETIFMNEVQTKLLQNEADQVLYNETES